MNGRRRRALLPVLIGLVSMIGGAALALWLDTGWNVQASSTSPDGRYRVDIYSGSRWQRAAYGFRYQDPGFARLSRTSDGRALDTSRIIDLADSPVTWVPAGAIVSTQTEYRYATGRWD